VKESLVDRAALFLESASAETLPRRKTRSKDLLVFAAVLAVVFAGLGAAYLVVSGDWQIAAALVFSVPALVVLRKSPFLGLVIWMVLSPFLVQTPSAAERQVYWLIHRFLPVIVLGMMLVSSALRVTPRRLPRFTAAEYGMLGYITATVLSILLQNNSVTGTLIYFYDHIFIPMCLYWVVKLSAPGEKALKWLVPVALFITVSQVAIGILSWVMPWVLPSSWLNYAGARTTGSLNSVSVYTTAIIFSGTFVLHTAQSLRPGWKRNLLVLVYLSTLYAIFISYSRASWLAGGLVLMGVIALYPRFMFRIGLALLPLGLLFGGFFLATQLQAAQDRLYSEEATHSALSRLPVLVAAYRMFEAKPLFGWGYENFDRYDRQFQGRFGDLVNPDEKDHTSHNVYLTLLAEQGLVGLLLILSPVFWLACRSLKLHKRLPRNGLKGRKMLALLWLVVLSYIVVNNFAPMVVVFGVSLYWITLGLIANILQSREMVR